MFVTHTHTGHKEPKEIEETAILNTITINNPNEMIGVTDKNRKNMAYFFENKMATAKYEGLKSSLNRQESRYGS